MTISTQISPALSIVHPITLDHGKNARVWDTAGREYIDFICGIGVLNVGHCHPQVVEAIIQQAQKMTHYAFNAVPHQPYSQLMDALAQFIPTQTPLMGMLTNSGAEATENALKVARFNTKRSAVIAFDGAFHGRTLAALNLNGKVAPYKTGLGALPGPVFHIPFPSPDNGVSAQTAIAALQRLGQIEIGFDEVAAIIVEPVQGDGGFQALDPTFATYLRQFCDQHGIVLILDEIQSGFGRTGKRFAFEHLGIEPDILLLGKSIAGGMPLGAMMAKAHLFDSMPKGSLGGTYSGNPVACAAALQIIELLSDDARLNQWATDYESTVLRHYQQWKDQGIAIVGKLTGIGAMRGIELCHPDGRPGTAELSHILNQAREQGLLLMPSGANRHIIRLLAPLTIEADTLNQGLDILGACLAHC
ncbi:aspartate aminotransferase family protein [uncultured Paenalcaligenes sp.]|uniref:2-aminoadipate transaminase n=1 Tax=uncultured Paenalcaligenes sp. TaxID=1588925 RepID=UPI002601A6E8|nr:aspartate aminotransferase family protein [uncultured Paenalcaligenes sp.]